MGSCLRSCVVLAGLAVSLGGIATLAGCATTSEPDPMTVKLNDMDERLGHVERVVNNQSLVALSQRIDALEAQLRGLRGDVEELQNSSESVRKQQRDLYGDLDKRVAALEAALKGGAGVGAGGANTAAGSGGLGAAAAVSDQAAYAAAFDRLKTGDYPGTIRQFQDFLKNYPNSSLADNAEYWLGKSYYVTHDYDSAAAAFRAVGEKWPQSRKLPDAMLDLGLMQIEQKHLADGRATLSQLVQRFPGTDAARIASDRLQKLPP
jgi:tol-pal system protein YbgF